MTATVTQISTRHSWLVEPRADDPSRHIRTCRRCKIRKRSEPDGRGWVELWLAADGTTGEGKVPACTGPVGAETEPSSAVETPDTAVTPAAVPASSTAELAAETCSRCGTVLRLYLGGRFCACGAAAVAEARAAHLAGLRAATSGMGVPTWRGEVA